MAERPLLPSTRDALTLFGAQIAVARRERRWTMAELAERVGVSYTTMQKVERGDPSVALGTAFEAAAVLGVPLFSEDVDRRRIETERMQDRLRLLPRHVHAPGAIDDDF